MRTVSKDKKILVSASLSCADLLHVSDAIAQINASDIDFVHYDVVDGMFNNCFVFGDLILEKIRPICDKPIEVHLAVQNVRPYIEPFTLLCIMKLTIIWRISLHIFALRAAVRYWQCGVIQRCLLIL